MAINFETNIGETDKKIRYAVGVFIVLMGLIWGSWLGLLGLVVIATAWFGWCPPYDLLGINTRDVDLDHSKLLDDFSKRVSSEGWSAFLNGSNLGDGDRYWRYGFSAFALLLGFAFSSFFWYLIAFILFGTAISTRCPVYHLVGFSSVPKTVVSNTAEEVAGVFLAGESEVADVTPIEAKEADSVTAKKEAVAETKPKPKPKPKAKKPTSSAKSKAESESAPKATKKAAAKPKAKPKTKPKAKKKDDLTVIEGIGPKIAEILSASGIKNCAALAESNPADIKKTLLAEGNRYAMHDPETWPLQAAMVRDGKLDELKVWQDEHKGGRKS